MNSVTVWALTTASLNFGIQTINFLTVKNVAVAMAGVIIGAGVCLVIIERWTRRILK